MEKEYSIERKRGKTYWHPLFHSSLRVAFGKEHHLEVWSEVPLQVSSLRMDFFLVKHVGKEKLCHPIAQQFRKVNLFEYKSPHVPLLVNDYNKAIAYTRLHQVFKNPPDYCLRDSSLTFVCTRWPELLFEQLPEIGKRVVANEPIEGIYQVEGDICPCQIVVLNCIENPDILYPFAPLITGERRKAEKPFIRLMEEFLKDVDNPVMNELVEYSFRRGLVMDYEKEEVMRMYLKDIPGWEEQWWEDWLKTEHGKAKMERAVMTRKDEIVERIASKNLKKGLKRGAETTKIELAKKALISGIDIKTVAQITGFSEETVRKFQQGLAKN